MKHTILSFSETMTRLRRTDTRGGKEIEYWHAREVAKELGYDDWRNFADVIEKAKENCVKVQGNPRRHFGEITAMVAIGSGATRGQKDIVLSRDACYLIALNGDPSKPEIAWAKAYFVVEMRKSEAVMQLSGTEERLTLREKLKEANKGLRGAAQKAGVARFDHFMSEGIQGLYGHTSGDVKKMKGIPEKEELWDRVGPLELSSNEFRAQLAREKLKDVSGQQDAEQVHRLAGRAVRETVAKQTGKYLEDLPAEPSLKKLISEEKKAVKAQQKAAGKKPTLPDSSSATGQLLL